MMIVTVISLLAFAFVQHRYRERKLILARQKMIKSTFSIYINNYDDIEFNQKVRKVQDADRMQLNVNNEQDLMNLANSGSPSGSNTNFFNTDNTRARRNSQPLSSFGGAQRDRGDIALGGMHFSEYDGENQTQSLNDTQFVEELQEQIENINGQNFEYANVNTVSTSEKKSEKKEKKTKHQIKSAAESDN